MATHYYDAVLHPEIAGAWCLGEPLTADGKEIDARVFTEGVPYWGPAPARVPICQAGRPENFHLGSFLMPVVSLKVADILREIAADDFELFPVVVEGHEEPYAILNVIHTAACVDVKRSDVRWWGPDDGQPDRVGEIHHVSNLTIDPARVPGYNIFRILGWELALIVSERVRDALLKIPDIGVVFCPADHEAKLLPPLHPYYPQNCRPWKPETAEAQADPSTSHDEKPSAKFIVEQLRSTGWHGSELAIARLDAVAGTRLVAFRQLERLASQLLSPWLKGNMSNADLWHWLRLRMLGELRELAAIVDETERPANCAVPAWHGARMCVDWLRSAEPDRTDYGGSTTILLIATMLLRQQFERELGLPRVAKHRIFDPVSSNVGRGTLQRAMARLGWAPFDLKNSTTIDGLATAIAINTAAQLARTQAAIS